MKQNKPQESLTFLEKARKIAIENEDKLTLAKILHQIGIAYQEQGKNQEAIDIIQDALKLAQEIDSKPEIISTKSSLSSLYELLGKGDLAFRYYREAKQLEDTIFNLQNSRQLEGLQSKFELEKKQSEIKLLEKDKQNQRLFSYLLLVGLGMVFFIAFSLYRGQQKQKKSNILLQLKNTEVEKEKQKSDNLLLNILPKEVAEELKEKGNTEVRYFESITVLFADVKGFSSLATKISPQKLIEELNTTFSMMDEISIRYGLERIKTIGDCYMACGGLPNPNKTHAIDVVLAALNIQQWMAEEKERRNGDFWEVRLGMHTGEAVAGVIGKTKFAYDVWGNTVNVAARMESGSLVGQVNITENTYNNIKFYFECEFREEVEAKNIGKIKAYYVKRLKPEYAINETGTVPNDFFWAKYKAIH